MEKRLFLAVVLSLAVLVGWSLLMPKPQHIVTEQVISNNPSDPTKNISTIQQSPLVSEQPLPTLFTEPEREISFELKNLDLIFVEQQAAIKSAIFKAYQNYKFPLKHAFSISGKTDFNKEIETANSLKFGKKGKEIKITKKFIFSNSNYSIDLDVEIQNFSGAPIKMDLPLALGVLDFTPKNLDTSYLNITVATKDKISHENGHKDLTFNNIKFLALRDRYFCAIVQPEEFPATGYIRKLSAAESEVGLVLKDLTITPGMPQNLKFHIYLGPQDLQTIKSANFEWAAVINYGMFDLFAQVILQSLEFFHKLVKNWGWAIILLSLAVYLVLFPLTIKQMRSMHEMQVLQPLVEEIRKKYKDNPQKMNQEVMALYKEHKVNPLGGCLPMLLQMPILFALYQVLMRSVSLRGADFLWIKDLSMPDRLFVLPQTIPVLGNEVNILPIIMTIGMFIQQKISTVSSSSSSAEQQKIMMIVMPIMFLVFFYHLPAGLVLYWVINSSLMLIYQLKINRSK